MPSASRRARTMGARRLTSSARSISATEKSPRSPLPGRAALATSTSMSPASRARRSTSSGSDRSAATARAPVSAARGSSTSPLRPLRTSEAPRAANARAIAPPSPPVAPVTSTRPPIRPSRRTRGTLPAQRRRPSAREDRQRRREAVQEGLAAAGPDPPCGEDPRRGRALELRRQQRGVVMGDAEHPAAAPVAREHERAGRRGAAQGVAPQLERLAEVAVGRHGVARVEPHDHPGSNRGADADRARPLVHVDDPAHEEVALPVLGPVRLEHEPEQQPAAEQPALALAELLDDLAELEHGGFARELLDHRALARGDGELRTDGRGALGHAGEHLDVVEPQAHGAVVHDLLAPEEGGLAVLATRARDAAEQRDAGDPLRQLAGQRVGGEGEGGGQEDRSGGAVELGDAADRAAAVRGLGRGVERRGDAAVERRGPDRHGGPTLDLAAVAEHSAGAAADQRRGRERLVHRGECLLRLFQVVARREDHGDVGRLAHEPDLGVLGRGERRGAAVGLGRDAGADADGHHPTILTGMPPSGSPPLPVVALFGPTGVGKTAVAAALADWLRFRGEHPVAISADALQVYEGLETLTGAAPLAVRARLEHRLLSFLPVDATFSAGQYAQLAHAEIDGALAAGRRPIVVGGTGLYLRAALTELDLKPPPPHGVRERLERAVAERGTAALHAELAGAAPWAAETIDPNDRRRIVRALERLAAGDLQRDGGPDRLWTAETRHPTLLVGLVMDREALKAAIDARVDSMVAGGAADEVRRAHAAGASVTARQALGFADLLAGDVEAMKRRTRAYARRQLTWMRKLAGVRLVDVTERTADDVAQELLGLLP